MKITFNNIRAEIARRGWTIEQFCEKLKIGKRTFYDWESKADLPSSYAVEIAVLFNTSIEYVLNVQLPHAPNQQAE